MCRNYKEAHAANYKECKMYKKEKEINYVVSIRGISYGEARRLQENCATNSYRKEFEGISYANASRAVQMSTSPYQGQRSDETLVMAMFAEMNKNLSQHRIRKS